MQMVLVLVTGHVLASSRIFKKGLGALAGTAKSPGQAIIIVTVVSIIASLINWGFGLVIGALFAKELAKKVKGVDYRLLIASAYSGFIVWHGGISGSVPLTIATSGHFTEDLIGVISTDQTMKFFSTEHWQPGLSNREPLENWMAAGNETMGQKAVRKALEILEQHEPKALPAGIGAELTTDANVANRYVYLAVKHDGTNVSEQYMDPAAHTASFTAHHTLAPGAQGVTTLRYANCGPLPVPGLLLRAGAKFQLRIYSIQAADDGAICRYQYKEVDAAVFT